MPVISTNTAANTSLRYLNENSSAQSNSLSKISSGQRIERASDDASGLAVSTSLSSDISILSQSAINADQGISVLQTVDGALSRMNDILQRMSSLAAQAINGGVDDANRDYIDAEFQELVDELDSIATSTNFNGVDLLTGAYNEEYLVGTDGSTSGASSNRLSVVIDNFRTNGLQGFANITTTGTDAGGNDYTDGNQLLANLTTAVDPTAGDAVFFTGTDTNGDGSVDVTDEDYQEVTIDFDNAAGVTYTYVRYDGSAAGTTNTVTSTQAGLTAAASTVNDFLDAINGSGIVSAGVNSNGALVIKSVDQGAYMSQTGMNALDGDFTDTTGATTAAAGTAATELVHPGSIADANANGTAGDYISVNTVDNAEIAANIIEGALVQISGARAEIGAQISRFEFRADVIATSLENLEAAKSSISDADIAAEQTNFTNYETLTEAAVAALAKANELPKELLRLLQG